ncbi:CcoQ/FixQ family Cbb3-type cytochrome c oxidase assembly chaperone [Pseudooceanicola nanhaiensis]|jgi:cytochrome c oxidase cbb3-type subunit 4|uniref:Cytochrome oxidase n=1 Tax=Pseudooceanicola nanhaiensis TaxID=375761 RepID=A0A917WDZ7_9RHOB|nr:CcoQ/FixQ family Cbb3-type cytochrome c oxidase assembly chaperone [Pseudooceanicola nanhaiensis]GGL98493.1 cytochrome oxidase [Pseudooceanicola nanhaiensis]
MELYTLLREFADSWMLLTLFLVFLAVFAWVFRPGSREVHADTASIPFRHEDAPAPDRDTAAKEA